MKSRDLRRLAEEGAVYLAPVRPNLVRQAKKASGMSGRQWKKWRKAQHRKAPHEQAAAFKTGPVSTASLILGADA